MRPLPLLALAAPCVLALLACPQGPTDPTPVAPKAAPASEPGIVQKPAPAPDPAPAEQAPPALPADAPPGDKTASAGWTLRAQLDMNVRDWRFSLADASASGDAALPLIGLGQLRPELDKLKAGEQVTLQVVPSEVWDHPGVLTDVHTALTNYGAARGLKLNLGEAIIPVHGIDSIRGDFEVICMEARNAKGNESNFVEKTRQGVVNVRVTKAFREATEMPVGERAAHLYAVANDEAKRRWRCAELEALWPPSEAAKKKIASLDTAPASAPAHPPMPARKTGGASQPAGGASQPSK